MAHEQAKVYFDGSHYIAIPHTTRPNLKKNVKLIDDEKKEAFEKAYKGTKAKRKKQKLNEIVEEIAPHFKNEKEATEYAVANMERKNRNLTARRIRLARKINMGHWNYFCTFTYDDKKHSEETFKKALSNCFKKLCYRKGWIYIGVWERAPKTNRLHFHGLFNIPKDGMVESLKNTRTTTLPQSHGRPHYKTHISTNALDGATFHPLTTEQCSEMPPPI